MYLIYVDYLSIIIFFIKRVHVLETRIFSPQANVYYITKLILNMFLPTKIFNAIELNSKWHHSRRSDNSLIHVSRVTFQNRDL